MITTSPVPASSVARKQQSYIGLGLSSPAQQTRHQQRSSVSANGPAVWPSSSDNDNVRHIGDRSADQPNGWSEGSPTAKSLGNTRGHGTGLSVHDIDGKLFGRRSFVAIDSPTSPALGSGRHLSYATGRLPSPSPSPFVLDVSSNGPQGSPRLGSARQRIPSSNTFKQDASAYQVDYAKHSYLFAQALSKPPSLGSDPRDLHKERRTAYERLQLRTISGRIALYLRRTLRVQFVSRALFLLTVLLFLGALLGVGRQTEAQGSSSIAARDTDPGPDGKKVPLGTYGRRRGRPQRGKQDDNVADEARRRGKTNVDNARRKQQNEDSPLPDGDTDEIAAKGARKAAASAAAAAAAAAAADFGDGLVTDAVGSGEGVKQQAKEETLQPTAADAAEEFEVNANNAKERLLAAERESQEREERPLKMRLAAQEKKRQKEALQQRVRKQKLGPLVGGVRADRDEMLGDVHGSEENVERKGINAESDEQKKGNKKQGIRARIQAAMADEGKDHADSNGISNERPQAGAQAGAQEQSPEGRQHSPEQQPNEPQAPLLHERDAFEANLARNKKAARQVRQGPAS